MQTSKRLNKTDATLVAQACAKVNGFGELYKRLERKISISGRSLSTLKNYSCHLAHIALHFNCLPTELDDEQIEDYLHLLQKQHNTPSDSYFKHTVYGLRFVFRLEGLKDNAVKLPSIKHEKKLPVILSREEVKQLLKAPSLLKHRVLLALLYGCGLRLSEVRNICLKDIDFNRDKLHIRKSKGKKDRYVPLGKNLIRGLTKYIDGEQPQQWLFNGQPNEQNSGNETGYSQRGIQWVVRKAVKISGIIKEVNAHTLRHTYATHLLEDGLDIVTIKELLGHECIETTMIYLHVAQPGRRPPFSPFDTLYNTQPMKPLHEVADVLHAHWNEVTIPPQGGRQFNTWQLRTLDAVRRCRTAAMGGHIDSCDNCGHIRISYNSCRNRHCPKCQAVQREQWIAAREAELLPVGYFHVVFTLPEALNRLCMYAPEKIYNMLFSTAWSVMQSFAHDRKHLGAETGMITVLHTWGQNLSLHPHLHCIVPAGGLTIRNKWKHARGDGKFLFPVEAMSEVFRARFVAEIRKHFPTEPQSLYDALFKHEWVVYAKQPFAGAEEVVEYLGRYTHKIAISNHRIESVEANAVRFVYKDYRDAAKKKTMQLHPMEFIRRFALHILPKGFVRIRHYGILSSTRKTKDLAVIHEQLKSVYVKKEKQTAEQICTERLGYDVKMCPCCKQQTMRTIMEFDHRGPPPQEWIQSVNKINLTSR